MNRYKNIHKKVLPYWILNDNPETGFVLGELFNYLDNCDPCPVEPYCKVEEVDPLAKKVASVSPEIQVEKVFLKLLERLDSLEKEVKELKETKE